MNPLLEEHDGETTVQFSSVWKALAVLSFAMLSAISVALFTWGVWVTNQTWENSTDIAILKDARGRAGAQVSQNVNVGDAKAAPASARIWLTTQEVAKREQVTDRTVLNYIEQGLIDPVPVKSGKEWRIAAEYRIVPNDAEDYGGSP